MGICRLLPHGAYALVCAVLSTIAWLSSLFQDGCDFAELSGEDLPRLLTQNPEITHVKVGFAQYRAPTLQKGSNNYVFDTHGSCHSFPSGLVQMDAHWKSAKGFAFMALVLGGGGTLFLWFSTCFVFAKGTWRWAGYELLLAAVFQALAFLWFGTAICHDASKPTDVCDLSWGSRADIVACVFWFVTAVAIFIRYPTPKDDVDEGGGATGDVEHDTGIAGGASNSILPPPISDRSNSNLPSLTHRDSSGGNTDPDGSLHLTDVPLEGDSSVTMASTSHTPLEGPTKSMTDAEVV